MPLIVNMREEEFHSQRKKFYSNEKTYQKLVNTGLRERGDLSPHEITLRSADLQWLKCMEFDVKTIAYFFSLDDPHLAMMRFRKWLQHCSKEEIDSWFQ